MMISRQRAARAGFSLVEVTIALGIASVALISVVGLLSMAMDTSEEAGEDTALAAMAGLVMGNLNAVPFNALGDAELWTSSDEENPPTTFPTLLQDTVYYFTQEGVPLQDESAAIDTRAHFQCVVEKTVDSEFSSVASDAVNLVKVKLRFSWPVSANSNPSQRPGKSLFHASIARY